MSHIGDVTTSVDEYLSVNRLEQLKVHAVSAAHDMKINMSYQGELFKARLEINRLTTDNSNLSSDIERKSKLISALTDICQKQGIGTFAVELTNRFERPVTPPILISKRSAKCRSYARSLDSSIMKEQAAYNKISTWFLECKFNPIYKYCRQYTLEVELDPEPVASSAPTLMESSDSNTSPFVYPLGIYSEIPCGNDYRGGMNCECMCRQYARNICRARTFKSPLDGPSMNLREIRAEYESPSPTMAESYHTMIHCIEVNMTRERSLDCFAMCEACNCCARHQRNFPVRFPLNIGLTIGEPNSSDTGFNAFLDD